MSDTTLAEDLQAIIDRIAAKATACEQDSAKLNYGDAQRVAEGLKLRIERLAKDATFSAATWSKPDCFAVAAELIETPDRPIEFSVDLSTRHNDDMGTGRAFAHECYGVNDGDAETITLLVGDLEITEDGYEAMKLRADELYQEAWCGVDDKGFLHELKSQPLSGCPRRNTKAIICGNKVTLWGTAGSYHHTRAIPDCPICLQKRIEKTKL